MCIDFVLAPQMCTHMKLLVFQIKVDHLPQFRTGHNGVYYYSTITSAVYHFCSAAALLLLFKACQTGQSQGVADVLLKKIQIKLL